MITLRDVDEAYQAIRNAIYHSPCVLTQSLSQLTGCQVYLKLENLQMTGSFKERGALNKLLHLSETERARGVIAASAGNHAQGVAYHARQLGSKAIIVMPEATPLNKVTSTRRYGAEVILTGRNYDEAYEEAISKQQSEGLNFIHAFDDEKVMAGQGTIALEIHADGIDPEAVLVPVGGGGLISGIAVAVKELYPRCRVIGVQTKQTPSMKYSIEAGRIIPMKSKPSLADGITVKSVGHLTFPIVQKYVDDIVLVDEEEIAAAILTLLETEKTLVEGAGATPLAALAYHDLGLQGKRTVLILSGGNIDINLLSRIIERGLIKDGRMVRLRVELMDTPGQLAIVSACIARYRANVLEVYHNRSFMNAALGKTFLDITLETRGGDHVQQIISALGAEGYTVQKL
ncbi:MAG TPA: threonine ammonia-lyase [bacterium]|nr:threonine ammonia-lyase [Candidatus Omnitrophota bacterium]HOJ58733.1 threonine ammonia-lyase [bacterium]HOL96584.1 threonine ammonia-lyase [bacterium]HPP00176.1 threonine ammonia-lyase [bacterium]HXK93200.1 threonine ammonia-lyase [bacterium]